MANFVSPGVYTIEKDISDYAPSINTSIVGVVGFASKGPTNKPTLITSQSNLLRTFGNPSEDILGQGLEGALEILEQTNSLYFVRCVTTGAADASATLALGSCPALMVSSNNYGATAGNAITFRIQVYDNNGIAKFTQNSGAGKDFVVPAGTSDTQQNALRKIIGGALDSDYVGVYNLGTSAAIVGSFAGSGASLTISACTGSTFNAANGTSALMAIYAPSAGNGTYGMSGVPASALTVYGQTFQTTGTTGVSYLVESLYPGGGYNGGTTLAGDTSGNSITLVPLGSQNFTLVVNEAGTALENFKVSFVGSGAFIEDLINTGETNTTSDVIKGNILKGGSDVAATELADFTGTLQSLVGTTSFATTARFLEPASNPTGQGTPTTYTTTTIAGGRFIKLLQTTTNLAGGNNGDSGDTTAALIGEATSEPKTGMQSLDDATLNIGIALVPGIHTQSVQNELITLAERTQNFMALVAPPYAIGTVQDVIDWTNGRSTSTANARTAAINSSYAAVHWPWVKVFSVFDGKDRWYDPSIFAARQMAYTDSMADSWFAPAGFRRGRLTKPTEVEVKLNQGDRDSLYSGGNIVNPIVSFPQQGITIFGQRTAQREPTALDRINVRRLMIYIRKVILLATQRFVFEPNDEFTWAQIEGVLNPFLDDIRRRRGITEFKVVCDETTNTPLRIDRNELWTKVLIKPTKTAEILIFEINLTNQSAQLGSI